MTLSNLPPGADRVSHDLCEHQCRNEDCPKFEEPIMVPMLYELGSWSYPAPEYEDAAICKSCGEEMELR